jgi:hypothetical protein
MKLMTFVDMSSSMKKGKKMNDTINHEGLSRLVKLQLTRLGMASPLDAQRALTGMVGVYDQDGTIIAKEVGNFYARPQVS